MARMINRKINRLVRCEVLFQVVGMYENSARVAAIMINEATAPPNAVIENDMGLVAVVEFRGE